GREQWTRVPPERLSDLRVNVRQRNRRHPVLQGGQLLDVLGGQEIGPGGENLPKLDERRAEVVEQHPKPARDRLAPTLRERLDGLLAAPLAPQPGAPEHGRQSAPGS